MPATNKLEMLRVATGGEIARLLGIIAALVQQPDILYQGLRKNTMVNELKRKGLPFELGNLDVRIGNGAAVQLWWVNEETGHKILLGEADFDIAGALVPTTFSNNLGTI